MLYRGRRLEYKFLQSCFCFRAWSKKPLYYKIYVKNGTQEIGKEMQVQLYD